MQYFKTALDALLGPEWIPINGFKVRICEQLGEGGFAFVYRCEDEQGKGYALKRILCQDEASVKIAEKEIRVLTKFGEGKHPHIVRFYGACKKSAATGSEFFLLMELCTGGNLVQLLKGPIALQRGLPEHRVCALFKQICLAVQVLHSHEPPLAHRDLKLENVLMTEEGQVKLCDFGSASTRCKAYTKGEMGREEEAIQKFSTPMYRAPEMVDLYQKWEVGYKADIWALGCILYVLAYLSHPFPDGGSLSIIGGVVPEPAVLPPPSPQLSSAPLTIVKKLLVVKPHRRPTIQKVLDLVRDWEHALQHGSTETKSSPVTAQQQQSTIRSLSPPSSSTAEPAQDLSDWDPFNQANPVQPSSSSSSSSPLSASDTPVSVHVQQSDGFFSTETPTDTVSAPITNTTDTVFASTDTPNNGLVETNSLTDHTYTESSMLEGGASHTTNSSTATNVVPTSTFDNW